MKRSSGILMPISSLPGGQGIGSLGAPARDFVDFLAAAGQGIWQILPVGPTGYGDSPYQSCSAFAGNPYFIDLDTLAAQGLLQPGDYTALPWGDDPARVDYGALYTQRFGVLRKAWANARAVEPEAWQGFAERAAAWLGDYCLYMAIKEAEGMAPWTKWSAPLRLRDPAALVEFAAAHRDELDFWAFLQYEFDCQWQALKAYANAKGVQILGDIPIYVSADSADAWAGAPLFETDSEGNPRRVAGCPPDYFAADGQLWGNPLYDWPYHQATGYAWWINRVRHALTIYDYLRIDHFRGFDTYWAIPAGETTARNGRWEQGPGMALFNALREALGELPIIAEDLGELFPSVRQLLAESGFPGMKVLQFAFGGGDNEYLPHNYPQNCVCYPGTHDNTTLADWLSDTPTAASQAERQNATAYFALDANPQPWRGMVRGAMASPAVLAITPMPDWLGLWAEGRINTPGKPDGNWQWRAVPGAFTPALAAEIRTMTATYFRLGPCT
ncbi:MAG: 4-alpha-glucanotransferase [Gemmiger sp.]|nr:4-alpha-glucanotransferase [Gemmiger sp.]